MLQWRPRHPPDPQGEEGRLVQQCGLLHCWRLLRLTLLQLQVLVVQLRFLLRPWMLVWACQVWVGHSLMLPGLELSLWPSVR